MSENFNLLIAEDDQLLASSLKQMIPSEFKVFIANDPELVPDHIFFHAALVDMYLKVPVGDNPDGPGIMARLMRRNPQIEIVSMSGDLNRSNMEAALKAGAQRFLSKPLSSDEVSLVLQKILAYWQMRQFDSTHSTSPRLIGQSAEIENIRKKLASLKNEKSAVLIEGETGTGKEIVARILNQQEGNALLLL